MRDKIFQDYISLLSFNAGRQCKISLLETLVSEGINNWRVVGITPKALERFANQNFTYRTGSRIQRAHVFNRHQTYGSLVDNPVEQPAFWNFIAERDRTILAIEGEYSSVSFDAMIHLPDQGLFPSHGATILFRALSVGYRFRSQEAEELRLLHKRIG